MQQGHFKEVADRLSARADEIGRDPVPLSRATELATLAFCHSQSGQSKRAMDLLGAVLADAATMAGLSAGDYCFELACRTLRACGFDEEAASKAGEHVRARNNVLHRPLAPFFRELANSAALAGD